MGKIIGNLLRQFRKDVGIRGVDLAKTLECTTQFISNVEHGRVPLPPRQVKPWSKALGVDPDIVGQSTLIEHNDKFCKQAGLKPRFEVKLKP